MPDHLFEIQRKLAQRMVDWAGLGRPVAASNRQFVSLTLVFLEIKKASLRRLVFWGEKTEMKSEMEGGSLGFQVIKVVWLFS